MNKSKPLPISAEYGFKLNRLTDLDIDRMFRENNNPPILVLAMGGYAYYLGIVRTDWLEKLIQIVYNAEGNYFLFGEQITWNWGSHSVTNLGIRNSEKFRFTTVPATNLHALLDSVNRAIEFVDDHKPRPWRLRVMVPQFKGEAAPVPEPEAPAAPGDIPVTAPATALYVNKDGCPLCPDCKTAMYRCPDCKTDMYRPISSKWIWCCGNNDCKNTENYHYAGPTA